MDRFASILDMAHHKLSPDIWNLDNDVPILRDDIKGMITLRLFDKLSEYFNDPNGWVLLYLIGSSATEQWTVDSDVDVTIVIDKDKFSMANGVTYEDDTRKTFVNIIRNINGAVIPGTKHPINYYVRSDNKLDSDAIYSIDGNVWLKMPEHLDVGWSPRSAVDFIWMMATQYARNFDIEGGKLRRDVKDLNLLKEFASESGDDIDRLFTFRLLAKLAEINVDVKRMMDQYDEIHNIRTDAFDMPDKDATEQEILQFSRNWLPANILYKVLERYGYIQVLRSLKEERHKHGLSNEMIDSISSAMGWRVAQNVMTIDGPPKTPVDPNDDGGWGDEDWYEPGEFENPYNVTWDTERQIYIATADSREPIYYTVGDVSHMIYGDGITELANMLSGDAVNRRKIMKNPYAYLTLVADMAWQSEIEEMEKMGLIRPSEDNNDPFYNTYMKGYQIYRATYEKIDKYLKDRIARWKNE